MIKRLTIVLMVSVVLVACKESVPTAATPIAPPVESSVCVSAPPVIDGIDMSGPYIRVISTAQGWVEIEGGTTTPVTPNVNKIQVEFLRTYRIRLRVLPCNPSEWVVVKVGPPNRTASASDSQCTLTSFIANDGRTVSISVPPAFYKTLVVTTLDANHRLGYQPDQTQEQLLVRAEAGSKIVFVGVTSDIPEASTKIDTTFALNQSVNWIHLTHAGGTGPNSVHGACLRLEN